MRKHIDYVAYIHLAWGAFTALLGLFLWLVIAGAGQLAQDPDAAWITGLVGSGLGIFLLVLALPELLGGWGLLKRQQWGRILIIIVSVINLFNIPVGTLIGGYSLWVLFNDDVTPAFA